MVTSAVLGLPTAELAALAAAGCAAAQSPPGFRAAVLIVLAAGGIDMLRRALF